METSSQLELAAELKYISQEELNMFDERIVIIVKQLARLRSSIKMQQE
jgi:four helix bundle protein